jgi:hypothetical protein
VGRQGKNRIDGSAGEYRVNRIAAADLGNREQCVAKHYRLFGFSFLRFSARSSPMCESSSSSNDASISALDDRRKYVQSA